MTYARIAAVTGGNKGIGLAIVRNLALQYPASALNTGQFVIYLTARDVERGEAAVAELCSDPQLQRANALKQYGGLTEIKFHSLDISKKDSVDGFAQFLKAAHPDGIDVIVNNAGIAMDGFDNNVVYNTLRTNYYGTLHATLTFLPLLRPSPLSRLVNVSSTSGSLSKYTPALQQRFRNAASIADITSLMKEFESSVAAGHHTNDGWPSAAYAVSKAGVTGVTRVIARDVVGKNGIDTSPLVNSCCPGYVNTDMTKGRGTKTADEGAKTPVLLGLGEIGGIYGEFWRSEKVLKW